MNLAQRRKYLLLIFVFLTACTNATTAQAAPPQSFSQAKHIASDIYADNQSTFYCGCDYHKIDGKLRVDLASCGYQVRKQPRRAARVEWEHVVPAWWIGHQRQCWQEGGRKNCSRNDPVFRIAEADLMNLVPAIGEVNGDRSNYRFGMIEGEPRAYGACDVEIDFRGRVAEPAPSIRGDIARIYFYMSDKYDIRLSKQQRRLFEVWHRQDPVDEWEKEKARRIAQITGSTVSWPVVGVPSSQPREPAMPAGPDCSAKRYCNQMTSCSEARYYLVNCGRSSLDRDGDGVPCEALCR